jgi:hypothetical protein
MNSHLQPEHFKRISERGGPKNMVGENNEGILQGCFGDMVEEELIGTRQQSHLNSEWAFLEPQWILLTD